MNLAEPPQKLDEGWIADSLIQEYMLIGIYAAKNEGVQNQYELFNILLIKIELNS